MALADRIAKRLADLPEGAVVVFSAKVGPAGSAGTPRVDIESVIVPRGDAAAERAAKDLIRKSAGPSDPIEIRPRAKD
ncbi:MAG TPA: hypothetical protein VD978_11130 [Azospirillum sp.]|nr:hypothetical protein [Azospirillum sp.]